MSELNSYNESATLDLRFRYWRLRYRLALNDDEVLESDPPGIATPAGDDIRPGAPVHSDSEAIGLVARVDAAILSLGKLDGSSRLRQIPVARRCADRTFSPTEPVRSFAASRQREP